MHKNRPVCYCRTCQNARAEQTRSVALPTVRPALSPLELMFAAIGLLGLLAWAWIISTRL